MSYKKSALKYSVGNKGLIMNWNGFEAEVFKLVVQALEALQAEHSDERFYAFSLYTDSSAMTIAFAANSHEALERKLLEEDEEDRDDSRQYYTWATSEWKYEAWRGELFKSACKALREDVERSNIADFRKKLYAAMTNVLRALRQSDCFKSFAVQEPVLFVTVTDDETAEHVENETARVINSQSTYESFVNRFEV